MPWYLTNATALVSGTTRHLLATSDATAEDYLTTTGSLGLAVVATLHTMDSAGNISAALATASKSTGTGAQVFDLVRSGYALIPDGGRFAIGVKIGGGEQRYWVSPVDAVHSIGPGTHQLTLFVNRDGDEEGDWTSITFGAQASFLADTYLIPDSWTPSPAWSGTQYRPRYIYDDRCTVIFDIDPAATQYVIKRGSPGFDPSTSGTTVATIAAASVTPLPWDATKGYYTDTGLSASTEYEYFIVVTISGTAQYSRPYHVTTTEAGAVAIMQDGDLYFGQSYFSTIATDAGTEVCIGKSPSGGHVSGGAAGYAIDARSDGNYRHFNYQENDLSDVTWPGLSGYYLTMMQLSGIANPVGLLFRANDGSEWNQLYSVADDPRGKTWAEAVSIGTLNTTYDNISLIEAGRPIVLADGSYLVPAHTWPNTAGSRDARAVRVTVADGVPVFTEQGVVYLDQTIAGVSGTEPVLVKVAGTTYGSETIVCLFRPNNSGTNVYPYMAVSTDSGQTWGAASQTDIGSGIANGRFGSSPPDLYFDAAAGRLWAVIGYRWTGDAAQGTYLFYTDTPTTASGWALATRVSTSTLAPSAEVGHGTIIGFGSEICVGFTECVGVPRSTGGTSNPYIGAKWFNKTGTITAQTLTKYTPATEPYAIPPAPSITATDAADPLIEWADVASDIGYLIQRCATGTGAWADLDSVEAGSESYADTTAETGNTYDYRVKALGLFEDSGYSNTATAEALPEAVELAAEGTVSATGDAALEITRLLAAEGSASLTADAALEVITALAAEGAVTVTGDAAALVEKLLAAEGTVVVTGDASLTEVVLLAAEGVVTITGDAALVTAAMQVYHRHMSGHMTGATTPGGSMAHTATHAGEMTGETRVGGRMS